MANVLVLEDDNEQISFYQKVLSARHVVNYALNFNQLSKILNEGKRYDLLIADTALLKEPVNLPTIFIFDKDYWEDLISCYDRGGIDYLIKPIRGNDLLVRVARAEALVGGQGSKVAEEFADITDELTMVECKIFLALVEKLGMFMDRERLTSKIWKKVSVHPKTLNVHISNIRRKLKGTFWAIEFKEGAGWRIYRE